MANPITTRPAGGAAASTPMPDAPAASRPQARKGAAPRVEPGSYGLPDARATKAIASVGPAGVALAAPGAGGAVAAPGATGAAGAPSTTPTQVGSVASILAIVDLIVANEAKIKQLAEAADVAGNVLTRVGKSTLAVAKDGASLTKRLWSGSWLGKIGAIFTAIGTGLLYAVGGILAGIGWTLHTVASAVKSALGTDQGKVPPKPDAEKKKIEQENAELRRKLAEALERLKAEPATQQRATVQDLVRRAGDGESGQVLREAFAEAELEVPGRA